MFARVLFLALPLLAAATAVPLTYGDASAKQCNTGSLQCCNSVQSSKSPTASQLLASLGVNVGSDVPVGITCSPLSVVGPKSNSCTAQPVCCANDSFNGVVAIGCTPINASL